jgi:hypothetical protein
VEIVVICAFDGGNLSFCRDVVSDHLRTEEVRTFSVRRAKPLAVDFRTIAQWNAETSFWSRIPAACLLVSHPGGLVASLDWH